MNKLKIELIKTSNIEQLFLILEQEPESLFNGVATLRFDDTINFQRLFNYSLKKHIAKDLLRRSSLFFHKYLKNDYKVVILHFTASRAIALFHKEESPDSIEQHTI